jgi:Raf kinase inhibitor-like YbhB/YbcL family protein
VRIHFEQGKPVSIKPFVTGFVDSKGEYARPCGNAMAADGSLLFSDDRNGVIYRVSYTGDDKAGKALAGPLPDGAMKKQNRAGTGVPLAMQRAETAAKGTLTVTSTAFASNTAIPPQYSAYDQDNSFPLAWSGAPKDTRSFALIMEDPDAKNPPPPVIHWVAWNIPAAEKGLREGLQKQDRLQDPDALRQGPNTSGMVGYRGPRPPEGDPPHHYHVQLFALDKTLDIATGSNRDELLNAMRGHVLARGELIGTFQRPEKPARP